MCQSLLHSFDAKDFIVDADATAVAKRAFETSDDLGKMEVFARMLQLMRYVSQQFWEDKRKALSAASRLRTLLLSSDMARDLKAKILEIDNRKSMSRGWKPEGITFLESLPPLEK